MSARRPARRAARPRRTRRRPGRRRVITETIFLKAPAAARAPRSSTRARPGRGPRAPAGCRAPGRAPRAARRRTPGRRRLGLDVVLAGVDVEAGGGARRRGDRHAEGERLDELQRRAAAFQQRHGDAAGRRVEGPEVGHEAADLDSRDRRARRGRSPLPATTRRTSGACSQRLGIASSSRKPHRFAVRLVGVVGDEEDHRLAVARRHRLDRRDVDDVGHEAEPGRWSERRGALHVDRGDHPRLSVTLEQEPLEAPQSAVDDALTSSSPWRKADSRLWAL